MYTLIFIRTVVLIKNTLKLYGSYFGIFRINGTKLPEIRTIEFQSVFDKNYGSYKNECIFLQGVGVIADLH